MQMKRKRLSDSLMIVMCIIIIHIILFGAIILVRETVIISEECEEVCGFVTKREYRAQNKKSIPIGGISYITIKEQEQFLVEIKWKDRIETFNNKELYDSVKEGDNVHIIYYKAYNMSNKMIEEGLKLP